MKEACYTCKNNLGIEFYHDTPEKCYFNTGQLQPNNKTTTKQEDSDLRDRVDRIEATLERWSSLMEKQAIENKSKPIYASYSTIPEFIPSLHVLKQQQQQKELTAISNDDLSLNEQSIMKITNHINMVYNSLNSRLDRIENIVSNRSKINENLYDHEFYDVTVNRFKSNEFPDQIDELSSQTNSDLSAFDQFQNRNLFGNRSGNTSSVKDSSSSSDFYLESTYSTNGFYSSGESSLNYLVKHYRPSLAPKKSSNQSEDDGLSTLDNDDCIFESLCNLDARDYLITRSNTSSNSTKEVIHFNKSSFIEPNLLKRVKSEPTDLTAKRKRGRPKKCIVPDSC